MQLAFDNLRKQWMHARGMLSSSSCRTRSTYFSPDQKYIFFAGPKVHIFRWIKSTYFSGGQKYIVVAISSRHAGATTYPAPRSRENNSKKNTNAHVVALTTDSSHCGGCQK
jgi:hypothetical protein